MFGFVFGTACLIALILILRAEHRKRGGRWGHWGHHGCHGGHAFWWHGKLGRNPFLRRLFHELDTTPGQEKAIRGALDSFFKTVREAKQSLWDTRRQLAAVFRSESFDETAVGGLIEQHDDVVDKVRTAGVDALAEIFRALDPQQRERLAQWLDNRPSAPPAGPYRTPAEG